MTTVNITDEGLEQWLKDYTKKTGQTPEEATETALRFLRGAQDVDLSGWNQADLKAEIQKGYDSGEATPLESVDEFLKDARARFEARNR